MIPALILLVALPAAFVAVSVLGAAQGRRRTRDLRARLVAARTPVAPARVDFRELETLPAPVGRYLRHALRDGAPMISGVRVWHAGTFNTGGAAGAWKPFVSDQRVVTRRPGFDWDGRIHLMPALPVRVHDAYLAGEGLLQARLFGLFPLMDLRDTGETARGELMRFLAEAAWYPTALLPGQGVHWEPVDERSAHATLADGALSATLLFTFNETGLIDSVRADARGRAVGGRVIPTPWHGRFWNYAERDGMQVPLEGEVAWDLPEGAKPYWRGRITRLVYEWAR